MTAEAMRKRVLDLIREYLQRQDVQANETAFRALNCLAGDIEVISIGNQDSK